VGFNTVGMSGPGSGTWTRLSRMLRGLARQGVILATRGPAEHMDAYLSLGLPNASFETAGGGRSSRLIPAREIEHFSERFRLDVLHQEAAPFVRIRGTATLGSIHDLRHFRRPVSSLRSAGAVYQRLMLRHHGDNVDAWLALSDWAKSDIAERLNIADDRIHVVPPIVELLSMPAERLNPGLYVLSLGHLEPRKNLEVLLEATASPEWPTGVEVWLAGADHGSGGKLLRMSQRSRVPVRFLGPVSETKKWDLLRQALAVAVPSSIEGFGIVAVEAPSAGTPAVVSDQASLPNLAFHSKALVDAFSPAAWASRIQEIAQQPRLRSEILEAQRAGALQFSEIRATQRLISVYQRVLSRSGSVSDDDRAGG